MIMVWCGVVWCGVVWCGVVWCGVVWCGVVVSFMEKANQMQNKKFPTKDTKSFNI